MPCSPLHLAPAPPRHPAPAPQLSVTPARAARLHPARAPPPRPVGGYTAPGAAPGAAMLAPRKRSIVSATRKPDLKAPCVPLMPVISPAANSFGTLVSPVAGSTQT